MDEIIQNILEELSEDDTIKDIFDKYNLDMEELYLIPITFSENVDVSAKTEHGIIYLNNKLKNDDDFPDNIKHYLVHELTHVAQQTTGDGPTQGSTDDNYLDNEYEQEGFQNQTEHIAREDGEEAAHDYIEQVLDHHDVTDPKERKQRKQDLIAIAGIK